MCWPKTLSKSSKSKGKANIDGGPPPPPPPQMKKEKHSTSYPPMSPPKSNIFPQTNGAWSRQPRTTEDVHRRPKSSSTNLGSHHRKSWAKALERLNRNNNVGVAPPPLTKKEKEQGSFAKMFASLDLNAKKFAPGESEGPNVHIYGSFAKTSTKPP
uniref:Uncharacterized protein n=1 Tax=Lactuca sativa TaxID=4236 RepID=A0A9R1XTZ0_LACSA|nr:hypothetical protein LSAT_V11C100037760 [Lactuca sativa]